VEGVTKAFLAAMTAPERQVSARVIVDYTDPAIDQSLTAAVTEAGRISFPAQTADAVEVVPHKWASLDGTWALDGTYHLAPDTADDAHRYQVGWWGVSLAGAGGAFTAPYPALTVNFLPRPVHSLRVVGDSARGEYPVDFSIRIYDEANVLLHEELVTGNAGISWGMPLEASINSVTRMVLEITRWSHAGRQVKITEFFTSVQQTYEASDLLEISLLEEREVSQGSLPVGTISANEVTIRLSNEDRRFDADNDQSPVYQLLKPNRRIRAWMGVDGGDPDGQEVAKTWDSQADWKAGTLPPQAEATVEGSVRLYRPVASFSRASAAYLPDGTQIAAAAARYWLKNWLTEAQSRFQSGWVDGGGSLVTWEFDAITGGVTATATANTIAADYITASFPASMFLGQPITFSVTAEVLNGTSSGWRMYIYTDSGTGYGTGSSVPITGSGRFSVTRVVPLTVANSTLVRIVAPAETPAGTRIRFSMAQVEDGEVMTSWRPGGAGRAVLIEEGTTNLLAIEQGGAGTDLTTWQKLGSPSIVAEGSWHRLTTTTTFGAVRGNVALSKLVNGRTYACSIELRNDGLTTVSGTIDWCDQTPSPFSVLPGEKKRFSTVAARATYDSTYRFVDVQVNGSVGSSLLMRFPQVEDKAYSTSFTDGTRSPETLSIPTAGISMQRGTVEMFRRMDQAGTSAPSGVHRNLFSLSGSGIPWGIYWPNGSANMISATLGAWGTGVAASISWDSGDLMFVGLSWDVPNATLVVKNLTKGTSITKAITNAQSPAVPPKAYISCADIGSFSAHCNGMVDDLRILTPALTAAQMLADADRTSPFVADEHTVALLHLDGNLESVYPSEATVTLPAIDLSPVGAAATSEITWSADAPAGTSVELEASMDGQTWAPCSAGDGLPVINVADEMMGKTLRLRAKLATTNPAATPILHSVATRVLPREYVALGTFWSTEWQASDDTLEAQVIARDRLEPLRKSTYQSSVVQANVSLYDLALSVLQDAGLEAGDYYVDPALQAVIVPYAWFEPVSHREALRLIAEAAFAQIYCDRDGVIRVDGPGAGFGATVALEITADNYVRLNNPMRPDQVANEILVDTQPLKPAAAVEEVYRSNDPISVPAGQSLTVTVHYSKTPVIEGAASLEGAGVTITAATYYGWGAEITLSNVGGAPAAVTVVVTGRPLSVQSKERAVARDAASITEHGTLRYKFADNPLVQTLVVAQQIAQQILASSKDARRDLTIDWRGNPALELGDRITVKGRPYHVIRQQVDWAGALSATTTGRRVT